MRKKKPAKLYKDFPLFLHATGQWAKKINGRMHYFGKDADAAAEKYERDREALYAGRTPAPAANETTVMDLANRFLTEKRSLMDSGELSPRTWRDYYACCERMFKAFGRKTPLASLGGEDFARYRSKMAKRRGAVALGNEIQRVRSILFDARTWKQVLRLTGPTTHCFGVAFSADGSTLFAACSDGIVYSWDTKTGNPGQKLDAKAGRCDGIALSPDGKVLATGHVVLDKEPKRTEIHLWDATTAKPLRTIASDSALLWSSLTFTPDGKSLAGVLQQPAYRPEGF